LALAASELGSAVHAGERWTRLAVLALILATGAALRFWGIGFGLPHDFVRPDEEIISGPALRIFQGDLNPHYFHYPTLFIYANAAVYALLLGLEHAFGTAGSAADFVARVSADASTLRLVGRALAASAGVATIAALYAAAGELFSRRAAMIAAAFLSVAFLHVRDSHFGVTDVPMTLLVVCAFWAAARCATRGATLPRVAVAGLVCGLAASTKYNAALIVAPTLAVIAADIRQRPATRTFDAAAVLALGAAIGFLIGTPFAALDARTFLADLADQRLITFAGQFAGAVGGASLVYGERGWTHHLTFTLRYGLGLPLLGAGLIGACWLVLERSRTAVVALAFAVLYYIVMGNTFEVFVRHMIPVVPFLCLTAGVSIDRIAGLIRRDIASNIVAIVLVLVVAAPTAARSVAFDRLVARPDTRVLGAQWVESRFPAGATMYQTGAFYGHTQPRPRDRYVEYGFNEVTGRFENGALPVDAPDIVVRVDSPLVLFNHAPAQLEQILRTSYILAETFAGAPTAAASDAVYDQQDVFYVPFGGVTGLKYPGPTLSIFERRDR
jgi:4-amino-4-deoxy-L-arabinose transferase-like glycosyltransferase